MGGEHLGGGVDGRASFSWHSTFRVLSKDMYFLKSFGTYIICSLIVLSKDYVVCSGTFA